MSTLDTTSPTSSQRRLRAEPTLVVESLRDGLSRQTLCITEKSDGDLLITSREDGGRLFVAAEDRALLAQAILQIGGGVPRTVGLGGAIEGGAQGGGGGSGSPSGTLTKPAEDPALAVGPGYHSGGGGRSAFAGRSFVIHPGQQPAREDSPYAAPHAPAGQTITIHNLGGGAGGARGPEADQAAGSPNRPDRSTP